MKTILRLCLLLLIVFGLDLAIDRLLLHGIHHYYGLNEPSEMLLLGHSQLMLAADKERMENELGLKISKYTQEGVDMTTRKVMAQHYLSFPSSDSLRYVLYGVDQFMFNPKGLSAKAYKLFYPFLDNRIIDRYIRTECSSRSDYWAHKLIRTTRYSDLLLNASIRGWLGNWSNLKYGTEDIEELQLNIAEGNMRQIAFDSLLMADFLSTIDLFTAKGIRVILVRAPVIDLLNDYQPDAYKQISEWLEQLAERSPLIDLWDINSQMEHDHTLFFDPIHLNPEGQQRSTELLVERFKHSFAQ